MESYYRNRVKVATDRLRVIPNGVDVDRFRPNGDVRSLRQALGAQGQVLIGTAGRFFPVKRYEDFLQAAARVCRERPDVRFVMFGDGPERPRLERMAVGLGLTDRVSFAGWRVDLSGWLAALDVFVMTSASEGLPLVALEAMAAGVPLVATPVGDLPQVVKSERNGFLVPVGDVEALAAILMRLADGPALRKELGRFAREWVSERYSRRSMVESYAQLYAD